VESVHEEISDKGTLDDGSSVDHVCAGTDGNSRGGSWWSGLQGLKGGEEGGEVREASGTIGVGEDGVGPTSVAHAVSDGATFAAVFGEGDDTD